MKDHLLFLLFTKSAAPGPEKCRPGALPPPANTPHSRGPGTEHSMLRRKSNMEMIQILILQPVWSITKECVQKQISNDKWYTTSTRTFCKSSSASLDCINEWCCAIDSTVVTVRDSITSQHQIETLKFGRMQRVKFIAWNKWKMWKPKQYEITATILPHKILQLQLLG